VLQLWDFQGIFTVASATITCSFESGHQPSYNTSGTLSTEQNHISLPSADNATCINLLLTASGLTDTLRTHLSVLGIA